MIKKLFFAVIIFLGFSNNLIAQGYSISILGEPYVLEGSTVTYAISFSGTVPTGTVFGARAVNGTVLSYTINPASRSQIVIQWNCKVTSGTVQVWDETNKPGFLVQSYNQGILSYISNPNFCNEITPAIQNLLIGQSPTTLSVINCTPICASTYNFQYQWQEGEVPQGTIPQEPPSYMNINGETGLTFTLPTSSVPIIKAYRRVTSFTENGIPYSFNSKTSIVNFEPLFNGGSITGTGYVYPNTVPIITQTPAYGGLCSNYFYVWERSENNGPWVEIGVSTEYPAQPITTNCSFRRKAYCGNTGAFLYTNTLNYIVCSPLYPGFIVPFPPYTLPYNAIPNINEAESPTGGLCSPSNYIFTWERSVENGPWQVIGTGQNYPSTVGIVGNSKFRRKISCGSEELYTNIVSFAMLPYSPTSVENKTYVRINTILIPNVYTWGQADNLPIGDKIQTTTYYDGLARPIQSNNKETSEIQPNVWADMVGFTEYDNIGRSVKSYSNYPSTSFIGKFKENPFTEHKNYVVANYEGETLYSPAYGYSNFENSPLNRVLNTKAAGVSYLGNNNYLGNSFEYEFNTETEQIKIWNIDFAENSIPYIEGNYSTAKLSKSILIDEKNKKVIEYKDYFGRTILKKVQLDNVVNDNSYTGWLSTYYVYDDMGQLRSTITPKAVTYLLQNSWIFNSIDVYNELCFYEHFDERGRTIIKHSAGAGEIHLVYDKRDRLVLSQDEKQRQKINKQWSFYLYDKENRQIVSGLFDNSSVNRSQYQTYLNTLNNDILNQSFFTGQNENIKIHNPIVGSGLGLGYSNLVVNGVQYFDNYDNTGVIPYTIGYSFPPSNNPYIEPDKRNTGKVLGLGTGSKVRIINELHDDGVPSNDQFLTSTAYFDDKGRSLQGATQNIKGGIDYVVMQYDYAGKLLSSYEKQTFILPAITNKYSIITKYEYNKIGKLTSVSKQYNSQAFKKIVSFTYDAMGRIKLKKLSPDFNSGAGIESLKYDYNLQGLLTGINKDYALNAIPQNQFAHYFGIYLGYENRTGEFSNAQYNGNITGLIWRTQGEATYRKYNFEYDNAERLTTANFTQLENSNWANSTVDFSMTGVQYDENGNLKFMNHKGIIPGRATPAFIDKLEYTYKTIGGGGWSNKLDGVKDVTTDLGATNNGLLGDFKDEFYNVGGTDYNYDANGNLTNDNNKKIRSNGVNYNFMDKPQKIIIEGKSITEFIYDATGDKLGKKVTNTITNIVTTTWYNGAFVYEEVSSQIQLQYISHEEGRVRVYQPVVQPRLQLGNYFDLPNGTRGVFEFFVKDHLQNTRAILSEETHLEFHNCTMEIEDLAIKDYEEKTFGVISNTGTPASNNEVKETRRRQFFEPEIDNEWTSNNIISNSQVSKLSPYIGANAGVGPNMMLKVMAGDKLHLKADYFYTQQVPNNSTSILHGVVTSIFGAINGGIQSTGSIKGSSGQILTGLENANSSLNQFLQNQNSNNNTNPKAYINYLFFDENFNFIPYDNVTGLGSSCSQVNTPGDGQKLILTNIQIPKNGYAYVYLSNSSTNINVFFDNFEVTHERGRLVEENAYYPYGLKIKSISGKALGKLDNKFGYQGDFAEEEQETGWDEFDLRMYDPQIGRWIGTDPYDEFPSQYVGMGNSPSNYTDPDGGNVAGLVGSAIGAVSLGFLANNIAVTNNINKGKGLITFAGALIGAGLGYAIFESLAVRATEEGSLAIGGGAGGSYNVGSHLWSNFKAFYFGLLGIEKSFGGGLINVVNSPNLHIFEWVEFPKFYWATIDIQDFVTKGYNNKSENSTVLDRNEKSESKPDLNSWDIKNAKQSIIIDRGETTIQPDDDNHKTTVEIVNQQVPGNFTEIYFLWTGESPIRLRKVNTKQAKIEIILEQDPIIADKYNSSTGSLATGNGTVEAKVRVKTKEKVAKTKKRLTLFKFLKTPITKSIKNG